MATTPKVIQVLWIDAVADAGWEAKTKAEVHLCTTVGYLIDESEDAICLASTWSIDQTNARMHIPKAWIKNRKVLANETTIGEVKRAKPAKVGRKRAPKKISATKRT